jgi:hypothetical protein
VDRLGVGQQPCTIGSGSAAKGSIEAIMVICTRCGLLMPLAADHIAASAAVEKAA